MRERCSLDHESATVVHALRRFEERCGIRLFAHEYERMVAIILRDRPDPIAVTREGMRVFKVRVRGATGFAVWRRNQIATFYPSLEWVSRRGGRVLWRNPEWEGAA